MKILAPKSYMRILQTETLFGWGGQQRKVLLECLALRELGHCVTLVCNPSSRIAQISREHGFDVIALKMTKKRYLIGAIQLARIIKKLQVDLVISHGSTDSWISLIASRLSNRKPKFFRERHNVYPIAGALSRWLHKHGAHKILSISETVSKHLESVGVLSRQIIYLPDAIDPTQYKPNQIASTLRSEICIPGNAIVLGALTSHRKDKGVFDLAHICKKLLKKNNKLWFIFAGPYRENDRADIEVNILNDESFSHRIKWTGYRDDTQNVINGFDIFLHLTKSEGLGTVTIEAMYCKKPIAAWNIPAMRELIPSSKYGYLANYQDFDQLCLIIDNLISNEKLRHLIGENNHYVAKTNYSYEALKMRLSEALAKG